MRHYPKNSPRAGARVAALALLADGHLSRAELEALERGLSDRPIGLQGDAVQELLREVTEDLLTSGAGLWDGHGRLDAGVVAAILADVDDPTLQRRVLDVCEAVTQADGHLSDGERAVMDAAARRWTPGACLPC